MSKIQVGRRKDRIRWPRRFLYLVFMIDDQQWEICIGWLYTVRMRNRSLFVARADTWHNMLWPEKATSKLKTTVGPLLQLYHIRSDGQVQVFFCQSVVKSQYATEVRRAIPVQSQRVFWISDRAAIRRDFRHYWWHLGPNTHVVGRDLRIYTNVRGHNI